MGKLLLESRRRRAALLVLLATAIGAAALTESTPARADGVVITDAARSHFAAGVALLKDPSGPRYEAAYLEFKAAYAASPSYKILGNLGLCAMQIERDLEATQAYEAYLKQGGADIAASEREQIERDLLTITAGLVRITISSDPPGATITDVRTPVKGSEVRNFYDAVQAPVELGLRRGRHVLTAKLSGFQDAQWELGASEDAPQSHTFKMVPVAPAVLVPVVAPSPEPPRAEISPTIQTRPIPTRAYVSGGVAVALLATGTIFGLEALQKHSDFQTLNNGYNVGGATNARNTGVAYDAVADGCFAAALAGALLTTYFIVARPTLERPAARLQIAPTWTGSGPGAAAVWLFE